MAITARLDRTDFRILAALQENAALSVAEVSACINLSQNACWRRMKRLDEEGYILRRVALLDYTRLGAGLTIFVMIRTSEHSEEWLDKFRIAVSAIPEIMEIYRVSGDVDYLLKLRVADMSAYDLVYRRLIRAVKLYDVTSAFSMEEIKMTTSIALPNN